MALECPPGLIARVIARERAAQPAEATVVTPEPVEDGRPYLPIAGASQSELAQLPVILPPLIDAGWCSGYYDDNDPNLELRRGRAENIGRQFRAR